MKSRSRLKRCKLAAFLFCALLIGSALQGAWAKPIGTVKHVRIGVHETHTRFVFDISNPVTYQIFTLTDPYRVVIDMPELEFALNAAEANQSAGLVARYRYGLFKPGLSRVVLDTNKPVTIAKQFTLPATQGKGMRLVYQETEFDAALSACQREARSSFGDVDPGRCHLQVLECGDKVRSWLFRLPVS